MTRIRQLVARERRRQRGRLLLAGASAGVLAIASVLLLGVSGWFITSAALAGLGGASAAWAFNVLLPSAGIRMLAILRTGCRYTERLSGHDAAFRALARIRPALYRALAAGPPGRALAMSAGDAVARVVQDVDEIEAHFVRGASRWGAVVSGVAGGGVLLLAGPAAALGVLGILAATVAATKGLAIWLKPLGHAVPRMNGALKDEFATLAVAGPELCAYGLEAWAAARIARRADALVAAQRRVTAAAGWFETVLAVATGLAAMTGLALTRGSVPMAALATLAGAVTIEGVAPYLRGLQRQGHLEAAEARLDAMLDAPAIPRPAAAIDPTAPCIALHGAAAALRPGTIVGIFGPSGCGKTTLAEQMLRLRDIAPGRITLDGRDLTDMDPAVARACFAYAPQNAALLAGTVRDNLRLAARDAPEAALWEALHDAALDDRVRALPGGLDGWLGENGAHLSGGERRRLCLARSLLRPAPWLLLDEPTEGLDAGTEALVMRRLRARLLARGQGALIISHRPHPLQLCSVVLECSGPGVLSTPRIPVGL